MKLSPVLSPDGRPIFSAGGKQSWKQFEHRGFVCSLEWVGEGRKVSPAMVIWPQTNVFVTGEGAGIWAIGRRALVDFVGFTPDGRCTGGASEHCMREAREALPILGKDRNDKAALMALVDTVIKGAPELVHMPVAPRAVRQQLNNPPLWDITQTDKSSGKVIRETEV